MSHNPSERGYGRSGGRGRSGGQSLPFHHRGDRGDGGFRGGRGGGRGGRGGVGGGAGDIEVFRYDARSCRVRNLFQKAEACFVHSQGPGPPPGVDLNVMRIKNDTAIKIKQSELKTSGVELPLRPASASWGKKQYCGPITSNSSPTET